MKTEEQIKKFLENFDSDRNRLSGMTFEQGVEEALLWVLDEIADSDFYLSEE